MGIVSENGVDIVAASAGLTAELRAAYMHSDTLPGQASEIQRWLKRWLTTMSGFRPLARNLLGLSAASFHVQGNLAVLVRAPERVHGREITLIAQWPDLVDAYIAGRDFNQAVEALMRFVIHPAWPCQLGLTQTARLREQLYAAHAKVDYPRLAASSGLMELAGMATQVSADETAVCDPLLSRLEPIRSDLSEQRCIPRGDARQMAASVQAVERQPRSLREALAHLAAVAEAMVSEDSPHPNSDAIYRYAAAVQAAIDSAVQVPAPAWLQVLRRLQEYLGLLTDALDADGTVAINPHGMLTLVDLPQLALALLDQPQDSQVCDAMLSILASNAWPGSLSAQEMSALRAVFGFAAQDPVPASDRTMRPALVANPHGFAAELNGADGASTQHCDVEHLAVLAQEFSSFALGLQAEIDDASKQQPARARRAAIERYGAMIRQLADTCATVGLTALGEVCAQIELRTETALDSGFSGAQCCWLRGMAQHVCAYLVAPNDAQAAGAMVELLSNSSWPPTLSAADANRLKAALTSVEIFTDASLRPKRPREARTEDVSLTLPPDISAELLDTLLSELRSQCADFASAVESVVSDHGSLDDLDVAKRAAHTLKGAAHTMGVRGIASLTHHLEDILIALTRFGVMPTPELTQVLTQAADCLETMSESLRGATGVPNDAQQALQKVLDWANRFDDGVIDELSRIAPAPQAARASTVPLQGAPAVSASVRAVDTPTPAQGKFQTMPRVPAAMVGELLRLVSETMIANAQIKEQLRRARECAQAVTHRHLKLQQLTGELEALVGLRGKADHSMTVARNVEAMTTWEFEGCRQLRTTTRHLIEVAADAHQLSADSELHLKALSELLDLQGRLQADSQQALVNTRMVPVVSMVPRLQRCVRQTSRLLHKTVALSVLGEQTLLDANTFNDLLDPLMHLLRNAVDHGIEPAQQRVAAGKPVAGQIELSFAREGSTVLVRCSDDGAGLDLARIRAKALERGLLGEGQAISDHDLARTILLPGLSTCDVTSEVSGRGIGMDAVHSRVQMLRGSLQLSNRPAQGLVVELRVPISPLAAHDLPVQAGS